MENEAGAEVVEAGPSMACQVTGFQDSPQAGLGVSTDLLWRYGIEQLRLDTC